MVVVSIGSRRQVLPAEARGWRGRLIGILRRWLGWIQRTAPGPDAVNQGWRHDVANLLYSWTQRLAGHKGQHQYTEGAGQAVLKVARQNPGSRILVVSNIQYCHHIRPQLRQQPEVRLTNYATL